MSSNNAREKSMIGKRYSREIMPDNSLRQADQDYFSKKEYVHISVDKNLRFTSG
jgi:hypothetical protein